MIADLPPERWHQISGLLDEALERPPQDRPAFLDGACRDDADLRRRVEALLEAAERSDRRLDEPAFGPARGLLRRAAGDSGRRSTGGSDAVIGPYRLLGPLPGEEGWRALASEPVRREVALKILDARHDAREIADRLAAVKPSLDRLDHAGIARVLDVGTAPDGRPYLAVEYVQGEPLPQYCDEHRLKIRERLDLFTRVCEVVEHAHERGVAHGDLRPSRVIVEIAGDRLAPRVVDFGVTGIVAGSGGAGLLEPRTDLLALGAMLHELLTGRTPTDPAVRPSAIVLDLGAAAEGVARDRRTQPDRLVRRLTGELDWVVLRALDRRRGYESVAELRADLERHLDHEPVTARPRGKLERLRDWIRGRL